VGTKWGSEGEIAAGFDRLDHPVLVSILRETIQENRCLRLIEPVLRAGYLEAWQDNATRSGRPQGAVVSPMRAPISRTTRDQ
jgi:retron-type reverse transcriptase